MKTLEEQVNECIRQIALNEGDNELASLPYLYVTEINNSLNPACCKVGYSGRDDGKGSEDIKTKLNRYSTPVPDDWKLHAMIVLKCDSDDARQYEKHFIKSFKAHGEQKDKKELFNVKKNEDIDSAVIEFINDVKEDGNIKDVYRCCFANGNGFKWCSIREVLKTIKESNGMNSMLTEGKHWPADYVKTGINMVKASQLSKHPWYTDAFIRQDMKTIADEFEPLSHKNSNLGFFSAIIRWFIEYSGSSKERYQEFIEMKLDSIIRSLQVVCNDPVYDKMRDQIKQKWTFEQFEELQAKIEDSQRTSSDEKMKSIVKKDDYDVIPIYSYEELNEQFGGRWTGYRGQSEWCHTNGKSTYSSWTKDGTQMFFVIAKKDWKHIFAPEEKPAGKDYNAYDEYGVSLVAILVDVKTGKLLNETLRWNHVIDPSHTNPGASVDHAFKDNWGDLCQAVGIDVKSICENEIKDIKDKLEKESQNANTEVEKILRNVDVISSKAIPRRLRELITSIVIPDNVTGIGDYAFNRCTNLTSVTIGDRVTHIAYAAFAGCTNLTNLTIGTSVTDIGAQAFYNCSSLTNVTIPDSVTSIGNQAFTGCSNLTTVTIPKSVTSIEESMFFNCHSLTSVTIPDGVTSIGDYAFYDCTNLTSVTIPDSVTSIGASAFVQCTGLTSVMIGSGVTSIGSYVFSYCTGLTSVTFKNKTYEEVKSMKWYPWGIKDTHIIHAEDLVDESKHDAMIHFWAHMLDECFDK